jgi:hypothetical protein
MDAFPDWHGKTEALEWALSRLFCEIYKGQDVERVAAEWKRAAEERQQSSFEIIKFRARDEAHRNAMVDAAMSISIEIDSLVEGLEIELAVQRDTAF